MSQWWDEYNENYIAPKSKPDLRCELCRYSSAILSMKNGMLYCVIKARHVYPDVHSCKWDKDGSEFKNWMIKNGRPVKR